MNGNALNRTLIQFYSTLRKFSIQYCNINTGNCLVRDQILTNLNEFNKQSLFINEKPIQTQKIGMLVDDHDYYNLKLTEENAFSYICSCVSSKTFLRYLY